MQSRKILLAIGLAAIVFGISGYLPTADAAQLQLNETNCTDFLSGSWAGDTCTISGDSEIGFEEDEETPNVIIISGPTTLELLAGSTLTVTGGIESLGTIANSGEISISEEGAILNQGIFVITSTGKISNEADFTGTGYLSNNGEIQIDDGDFNPQGQVDNYNIITIDGGEFSADNGMTNRVGGVIDNSGGFATGNFTNFGTFNNLEDSFLDLAGTIGTFTNEVGSTFANTGSIDIDPTGEFINIEGLSTDGNSDIELAGKITNHVPFTNNGNIKIKFAGQIINLSTVTNEGIIILETTTGEIPVIDSTGGTILTNNNEIQNKCGLIVGPFAGTDPLDQCPFTLVILSPSEGDIVTDVNPTTFSGLAQDRDLFGIPDDASEDIEWASSKEGILGTGSIFDFTLTELGNHIITATANDIDDNEFVATVNILVSQVDNDGDGYPVQNDCDDNNPNVNPGAVEIFGNGIDDNCNGEQDEGFTDADLDGFDSTIDCDDTNATVYPGAPEIVDGLINDCDTTSLPSNEVDDDTDGYIDGIFDPSGWDGVPEVIGDNDCDDTNMTVYPGAPELIDGLDNDCDGIVPLNEIDNDADGSFADLDCDDTNATVYPGAPEIVDGLINDCDTTSLPSNEVDDDTDGYIDGIFDVSGWMGTPDVTGDNDCDDTNAAMFPGAEEILDGFDNDCDGLLLDEEIDNDGDGQAEFQGDCDDDDKFNFLGNDERDDGQDNDCDTEVDEGFDLDGDGYTPIGGGDCDDTNPFVNQDALEIPDGLDNDCNGFIDDTMDKFTLPEFQENLDEKTIKDYEKMAEDLEKEIKKLEYKNKKLDKRADRYEAKAEQTLEGDTRKAAFYQKLADKFEDKGYDRKAAYFQAKADRATEGDPEKAAYFQAKADKLRAQIASNESLIEMYGKEILVINMSIGKIPVDYTQTIIVFYPDLTEDAIHDILHDIEDNIKEMEKLEKKAADYDEKADKEEAKGNQEKADEYRLKATIAREEIEIIEDLNDVLACAIDFTPDMLADHGWHGHHSDHDDDHGNDDKFSNNKWVELWNRS